MILPINSILLAGEAPSKKENPRRKNEYMILLPRQFPILEQISRASQERGRARKREKSSVPRKIIFLLRKLINSISVTPR